MEKDDIGAWSTFSSLDVKNSLNDTVCFYLNNWYRPRFSLFTDFPYTKGLKSIILNQLCDCRVD